METMSHLYITFTCLQHVAPWQQYICTHTLTPHPSVHKIGHKSTQHRTTAITATWIDYSEIPINIIYNIISIYTYIYTHTLYSTTACIHYIYCNYYTCMSHPRAWQTWSMGSKMHVSAVGVAKRATGHWQGSRGKGCCESCVLVWSQHRILLLLVWGMCYTNWADGPCLHGTFTSTQTRTQKNDPAPCS